MKRTFITVSSNIFYDVLRDDAAEGGETNWTVSRHAKRGDKILFYVCAPISAIIATATLETDTEKDDDIQSEWFGSHLADMHSLEMLAAPVSRKTLVEKFPHWGYWKQPRNSVQVSAEFLPELEQLLISM